MLNSMNISCTQQSIGATHSVNQMK